MTVTSFRISLPADLVPYATGSSDQEPPRRKHSWSNIKRMRDYRRAYIRGLLSKDPGQAYQLPDFEKLMRVEIRSYAKRELLPTFLKEWDKVIADMPDVLTSFESECTRLIREYGDNQRTGRPVKKLEYLVKHAKRHVFNMAVKDGDLLSQVELACTGESRYGRHKI